jgi:arginine-glutamic acid dipeptide repeat-containing protein
VYLLHTHKYKKICFFFYLKHFFKFRGRCCVAHYQDIQEAGAFKPDPDTFFYILTYNPEARRLANTQGEIRVGPSHQAKLPLLKVFSSSLLSNNNDDLCSLREELLWKNKTSDIDLSMYLQAARSIAAFAGMCDRGLAEDMYEVAQRDDTTINALSVLHNHDYDCTRAIQALVKCPISKSIDRKWSDDDQKKFLKGLRQYGKNFFRIRKDLLPHKQTSDLVEYYYLWKKTPQGQSSRPRRRHRPCSTSANLSTTPTPVKQRNTKTINNNNKDESEHNSDNDDNQTTTDLDEQYCRHCQTISKDLQNSGRDNQLLCYDCRMFYKKYGEMPILNPESSPYLFKPLNETSTSKRKRTKPSQSPDENSSSSTTRSKKKTRLNEKLSIIKQEIEEDDETIIMKKEIKLEEQENEKPSSSIINSSLHIKTEDLNSTILTPTPCKQECHSPSSILSNNSTKILIDHTKQNNTNLLLSSPSSAFSRTSKKFLIPKNFDEYDSSFKSNPIHPTILSGDVTPIISSKDNDLSNDDGNISDSSTNPNQEFICDDGPTPLTCDKGKDLFCYLEKKI